MRKPRIVIGILVSLLLMLGLALPVAAQVDPADVTAALAPGESITVEKTVTTTEIPPKPDIYFMSDTTGSMFSVIAAVSGNATAILAAIAALQPDAQFGVGNYKDFPYDTYCFQHQLSITSSTAAVSAAIGAWAAGGGWDGPEGQFYALTRLADLADPEGIGWRDGSTSIVVWFGDAPAHDPVPTAATSLADNITEATVTADLVAAGIRVVAISTVTGYPAGLDDDPTWGGGDYAAAYGIVEDGAAGQAGRIAAATGGAHLTGVESGDIVDAILEGLEALTTDVWWEVEADEGLTVELTPAVHYDVAGGSTVEFTETITVEKDAPQCNTLEATVIFYANEHPEAGAEIGRQTISIKVKDVTPPEASCVEGVNPHGKNVPGEKASGKGKGINPDGFYQLLAEDTHDPAPEIWVGTANSPRLFGPFLSGIVVKFTEAPGAAPSCKKIGSTKGQAGAVSWHITLPSEPFVTAVDASGNVATFKCFVPPPPK